MEIKAEFLKTGEKYTDILKQLRHECTDYLKKMVENNDIEFGVDDPYVTVTYDGGRHPEWDSNPYSQVHLIYVKDGRLMFDIDDADEYDADRVPVDELYCIASTVYEMYGDSPRGIN